MVYQLLQQRHAGQYLPGHLASVLLQLSESQRQLQQAAALREDPKAHAAFCFIQSRPIVLETPVLLFGSVVPTRHVQDVSLCRARFDAPTSSWQPDESSIFLQARIASSQFSDLIINDHRRNAPLNFTALDGCEVIADHESLDAGFVLDFVTKKHSDLHRFDQVITRLSSLREQNTAQASLAKIKESFSHLNLGRVAHSDGQFGRELMHEVMSKIDAKVKSELINDLSRSAHTPELSSLPFHPSPTTAKHDQIVSMHDFYQLHLDHNSLLSQRELLDILSGTAELSELHQEIHHQLAQVNARITRLDVKQRLDDPVMSAHKVRPALSSGCITISKPTGARDFFADRSDGNAHVSIGFSFATVEVNEYGEIITQPELQESLKLAMTSGQFLDLLQSSQIGVWTPCTLCRADVSAVPFPKTSASEYDGKFSEAADPVLAGHRTQIDALAAEVRNLLLTKTLNQTKRQDINLLLERIEHQLRVLKSHVESSSKSMKSEVIAEHREKLMPQLIQLARNSQSLSFSGVEIAEKAICDIQRLMKPQE